MKSLSLSKTQDGFSLVELAIIMIIMGLLTVPFIQQYNVYQERQKRDQTYLAFAQGHESLGNFFMTLHDTNGDDIPDTNNFYPCPSDPAIAFGETGHGVSVDKCWTIGNGDCSPDGGMCHRGGAFIGGVPYVTLGIPYTETIDGYKNAIKYVISDTLVNPANAADTTRQGTIQWTDNTTGDTPEVVTNARYGFIAPGENKIGSYNIYGMQIPCDGGTLDVENCDNDSEFVKYPIGLASNNNYFDDIVDFVTAEPASLWRLSEENPMGIYNTNTGPVGIGTNNPDGTVKLHVAGDVRAENFRATEYCGLEKKPNSDEPYCMDTDIIAGKGITCPDGQYLRGIYENKPDCVPIAIQAVTPGTCPQGQFVRQITTTGIVCAAPPTK